MSFFDEDDEPRRTPRPRSARPAGGAATDSQTLLIRRAAAGVAIVLFLILLLVAVNSCRTSQRENALKDYNRQLSTVATESEQQVGAPFFQLLTEGGGGSPQDLQTAIAGYRVQAEQQYDRAMALDVPGEMQGAQESALIALEWRRDALDYIAERIGPALGDEGEDATAAIEQIAGQMQVFLASDVVWRTRVAPFVRSALDDAEIGGQDIVVSRFIRTNAWLEPETVAAELEQQLTSGGGANGEPTGPGLHGTNIESTVYGDTTLQPGVANTLPFVPDQPFVVTFANGGENDEFDIKVTLRVTPDGGEPITVSDTVPQLSQGESVSVDLALPEPPPIGTAVEVQTRVAAVPGEDNVDNNRSDYSAQFVE